MSIQTDTDKPSIPLPEQPGFGVIELVMIVVLLAVLAGFAVPRVVAVREATPQIATAALGADLRVAVARMHAIWLAERQPRQLTVDHRIVRFAFGYPDRVSVPALLLPFDGFAYDHGSGIFARIDERERPMPDCGVRYEPPGARGEAPHVAIMTDGC